MTDGEAIYDLCEILNISPEDDEHMRRIVDSVSSMVDRLRWRKQSEEPAPDGLVLASWDSNTSGVVTVVSPGRTLSLDDHWRPI